MMLKTDSNDTNDFLPVLIMPESTTAPDSSKLWKKNYMPKGAHSGLENV